MPLGLVPMQDSAGDAWIQVWLHHGPASAPLAFVGMHAGALRCCRRSRCLDVLVFGGSGGAAEAATEASARASESCAPLQDMPVG